MPLKIIVGNESSFSGLTCSLDKTSSPKDKSKVSKSAEQFSRRLAAIVVACFLSVAGVYGLVTYDWSPLSSLWVVLGPIVGALTGISIGTARA